MNDPSSPSFEGWDSYAHFARRIRRHTRYVLGPQDQAFLSTVLGTIHERETELAAGLILFRAQRGVEWIDRLDDEGNWEGEAPWGYGEARMKPLRDRATEGRANSRGIPVLYVASTVNTAISEVRPWVGAEVSLAHCRLKRSLKTVDLSVGHGKSSFSGSVFQSILGGPPATSEDIEKAVWIDIDNAFSKPVTLSDDQADYAPTQILAELFRTHGYEAIGYKSQFGDSDLRKGYNIAIFDPDVVEIVACAPFRVDAIRVEASQMDRPWVRSVADGSE